MDPISITKSGKSIRIYTPDGYKSFTIQGLNNSLQKIFSESSKLTDKYKSTPKFPEFLGGDTLSPSFIRDEVEIIQNILNGDKSYSPQQVFDAAKKIKDIARNKGEFNKAFYGEVAKYYGRPNFSVKQTQDALRNKKFKVPAADKISPRRSSNERYESLVEWLYNEYRNISYKKIVNLSQAELMAIIDQAENEGTIPSKYTNSYYRKHAASTYSRDSKGTTIDSPLFRPIRRK